MELVYVDDDILVCLKPARVLSTDEPGGIPDLCREALGDPKADVRTVHRLDRVVAGLMVLARNARSASELSRQIREDEFEKEYQAVVHGQAEEKATLWDLLGRDKAFLDEIQTQMATAREFLFAVRMRNESDEQSFSTLNRIEKSINEQGFDCNRAEKDDVKRILSRYFGINTDETQLDDHDGDTAMEKWFIPD